MGERIEPENKQHLEDTAAYLVRNPLSLRKLVYLDGERAVVYRSRLNPSLGRNFEAMHPLEWLARLCDHIPDPGPFAPVGRPTGNAVAELFILTMKSELIWTRDWDSAEELRPALVDWPQQDVS